MTPGHPGAARLVVYLGLASLRSHAGGDAPYRIFKIAKDTGALQRDTWGAQVAEVLDTKDSDIVVDNKSTTCAFATTDLDRILVEYGITHSVLGGLLTNICIETTMRTAYDRGYGE